MDFLDLEQLQLILHMEESENMIIMQVRMIWRGALVTIVNLVKKCKHYYCISIPCYQQTQFALSPAESLKMLSTLT